MKMIFLFIVTLLMVSAAPPQSQILRHFQEMQSDGSYEYGYETDNGIYAQEEGIVRKINMDSVDLLVQGSFLYTSPEGKVISLRYTADENGFHPQGDHLPTPPPVPPQIIRALEWIAANPSEENQR